jgi:antimicrobial peptide system SdpA family protein
MEDAFLPTKRQLRVIGGALLALVLFWGSLCALALYTALPFNPIQVSSERRAFVRTLFPEGWKFFTRNPQEAQLVPYRLVDGRWLSASLLPNSRPSNLFGLGRWGRAQGVEMGILLARLGDARWTDCDEQPTTCLEGAPVVLQIDNPSPAPSLCGELALVSQQPVPWAWARNPHALLPSHVIRFEAKC